MPSTYSPLKIQLMATGENNTTWGDVTNLNLGTAIEEAIVGSADVTFASGDVTLTLTDTNASQTARNMRLRCTGTTGGSPRNLVVPSIEKPYIVKNDCADSVTVKTAAGTGIAVPAGKTMWVYSDGTNVVDAVTHLSSLTLGTDLSVADGGTGASTFTANGLLYGNGASALQVTAAGTTGQVLVGNTGSAPSWATLTSTAVTSISFGSTGLTPSTATQGAVTVAGTLGVANGGTGTATQFTAGSVVFAGASGVYSQSNANLFWDNGNARLGIGTASPTEKLDVNGVIKGGVAAGVTLLMADSSAIRNTASAGNTMYFDSGVGAGSTTGDFQFRSTASYTTRFYINGNTGNVGVGTTSPARLLEVTASGTNIPARLGNSQGNLDIGGSDGVTVNIDTRSWAMALQTGGTERMRITTAGLVGIGTSTPSSNGRLSVNGNIVLGPLTRNQAATQTVGVWSTGDPIDDNRANIGFTTVAGGASSSSYITFATNNYGVSGGERMRIDSSGSVGIGTASPASKLSVSNSSAVQIQATTGTIDFRIQAIDAGSAAYSGTISNHAYIFTTNNSERMRIDSSGNVLIGTSSSPSVSRLYVDSTEARIQSRNSTSGANGYIGAMNPNEWRGAWAITGTPVTFGTSDVERMRIDSSGNVSIGTTTGYGGYGSGRGLTLSNQSSLIFQNASNTWNSTTAGGAVTYFSDNNMYIDAKDSGSNVIFRVNGTSERMRIDQSGNVGIGTTSPSAQLDSFKASGYNDIRVRSGSNQTYLAADGTNAYVGTYSNIPLLVSTNNTERMRVTAGGDVGIGTSVPDVKVSIQDAGAGQITLKDSGGTTRAYIMTNGAIGTAPTNSLRIRGDSGVALGAVGSLAMFIDTSNNVGVGTSSPGQTLQVVNASNYQFRLGAGSTFNYDIGRSGSDGFLYFYGNQSGFTGYVFSGADGERMRITSAGNLQLGKASLATTATDGFPYIPTCAGTPTGTPTAITGYAPMVVDSTNNKLYVYVGGAWQAMN